MPVRRRCARNCARLVKIDPRPSTQTSPDVGRTSPLRLRSNVDFPAPEVPRRTMNFPRWNTAVVGRSATTPLGYVTATFESDNMSNPESRSRCSLFPNKPGSLFTQPDYQAPMTGE